ncbi:MAG TPA: hypothetical protein VFC46_10375 [Humisphaera sp.]|nr:hypothetical protein [Humisphaera sp.]
MISNDAQLRTVREQIQRLKSALASLERDVKPKSERQFQVLSEGYVDQIADLQKLITVYVEKSDHRGQPAAGAIAIKQ